MQYTFSDKINQMLKRSREVAAEQNSSNVLPQHILLSLLYDSDNAVLTTLNALNVDIDHLRDTLERDTLEQAPHADVFAEAEAAKRRDPETANRLATNRLLRLAINEARKARQSYVTEQHLLLAFLSNEFHGTLKDVLADHHLSYEGYSLAAGINHDLTVPNEEPAPNAPRANNNSNGRPVGKGPQGAQGGKSGASGNKKTPLLDAYAVDLTVKALNGELDPVAGREREIERVTEILCRRKKNNPVLIGEPGVGKSAIVEGLAQAIATKSVAPLLRNKRLLTLDLSLVIAGTKYRGQFEERIKGILQELQANPDIIVFIDEIHTLVGAGNSSGNMDAANMLKPALARGEVQCVGATTLDEYRTSIEKDGALERRFQKIIVEAPTADETLQILKQLAPRYAKHHRVNYSDEALQACVTYADRYITARQQPDKAIDLMDEAGAKVRLRHSSMPSELTTLQEQIKLAIDKKLQAVKEQDFERAAAYRDRQVVMEQQLNALLDSEECRMMNEQSPISESDIAETVALMTGIPVQRMTESEHSRLRQLSQRLSQRVKGQPTAIEKVTRGIHRNRIGLRAKNRPIGVFMFLGPTGVGKTHLAQQLAIEMFGSKDALIRVDMSEYTESFNTSRLIGAPPGYVGYEEGGQLTERVRRKPYSIVLLDEIEKAHSNVYNMLLQVLDEGRLTDGNGRKIDFTNTIIIMTSNTGTRQLKDFAHGIGFAASSGDENITRQHAQNVIKKALNKQFAPEFINRLDDIITFEQLTRDTIRDIVLLELQPLAQRVSEMGYSLAVSDATLDKIVSEGYDPQYGARPLKRAIQTIVEDAICEKLLSGELQLGEDINI